MFTITTLHFFHVLIYRTENYFLTLHCTLLSSEPQTRQRMPLHFWHRTVQRKTIRRVSGSGGRWERNTWGWNDCNLNKIRIYNGWVILTNDFPQLNSISCLITGLPLSSLAVSLFVLPVCLLCWSSLPTWPCCIKYMCPGSLTCAWRVAGGAALCAETEMRAACCWEAGMVCWSNSPLSSPSSHTTPTDSCV